MTQGCDGQDAKADQTLQREALVVARGPVAEVEHTEAHDDAGRLGVPSADRSEP
jgi:hypothetical protein